MAYTTINKSTDYFNNKIYTGNSGTQALTGVGFQPDMTWIKRRGSAEDHALFDAVRGVTKRITPSRDYAESTDAQGLTAFGTDGFTVGSSDAVNGSDNYASWNWKANGQGSSNTDGSINTTYTSVNTTAGFSISKFTGTGSAATVGHGLGVVPKMYIVKNISTNSLQWRVYHASLGATKHMALDATQAAGTASSVFNNTEPTSSVFSVGTDDGANKSGDSLIAYAFAEKTGYSKFGSYDGNGNTNGNFIYTGFKPKFIIIKRTDNTAPWVMLDTARADVANANVVDQVLYTNDSQAEFSSATRAVDLVSNGIKIRGDGGDINTNGGSYIYMAFGQSIVGSNNIPATAR